MDDQHDIAGRFLSLHRKGRPLLLANAWDVGAAKLLAALGDEARLYALEAARERVRAAAQAAHGGERRLVLTARAENHLRGVDDIADTIARLQAYEEAGADVLYAPGLREADEVRRVVESVRAPVNVLVRPGLPPVHELAGLG